jgi:NAD(P)-dependent dehydrogenase (short-subunit alcohol dehydrogenase family)
MTEKSGELAGKTAIVTGGGGSIGTAISVDLADRGANVVVAQRSAESATAVVDRIEDRGGEAAFVPTDVGVEADVDALVSGTVERFGGVDAVVNNAAHPGKAAADEMDRDLWDDVVGATLTGPFRLAHHALPHMRESGYGRIVNVGAIQAHSPLPGAAAYAASKAGLEGLTRSLAVEWSGDGVTVNTVHVGVIYSADWVTDDATAPEESGPVEDRYESPPDSLNRSVPTLVDRMGTPGDVAAIVGFLASPDAGFLTGQVLTCDGGRLISRQPEVFDQDG